MQIIDNGRILSLRTFQLSKKVCKSQIREKFLITSIIAGHLQSRICRRDDIMCIERFTDALQDSSSAMFRNCDCLKDCNSLSFQHKATFEKISPKFLKNFTDSGDFMLESEVFISFADNLFLGHKRVLRSELATLLSNIGAILWLFLGASALSITEIVYFFTLRFFNNLWV